MSLGYIGEKIPAEWAKPLLIELVNPKQWKTISTKDLLEDGFVVYGANGKIGFYNEFTHENPTLMITCRGATCGNLHISEPFAYINGNAMALDDQPVDLIGVSFLRHVLEARGLEDTISGSAQPQITRQGLSDVRIPLPPLAEQKVIADKLDTLLAQVDNTKARLERIPEILKNFRQSVLAAAVSGKLTEEWRFTTTCSLTLESFKKSLSSFRAKAKGLDGIFENETWISCQLGHVISVKSGDGLTAKDMIPVGGIPVYGGNGINGYHDKSNVSNSVIAIGRVGFYCGSVHLTETQAWITDNALIVDFPEQLFSKDFMYLLLRATNLREDSASTAQPVISGAKIYPIAVKIPPFEEQTEIVRRVEQLFAFADSIEQKTNSAFARVNNLTKSILAKAFRGELTADWRAANPDLINGDNSSEALLAKIKAERETFKTQPKTKSTVKKKTGSRMTKQIIKVVDALKEAGKPLSGQQLLAAAGYASDSNTDQLEQFFLDIREALTDQNGIVKLERDEDGQDWFTLVETAANK